MVQKGPQNTCKNVQKRAKMSKLRKNVKELMFLAKKDEIYRFTVRITGFGV